MTARRPSLRTRLGKSGPARRRVQQTKHALTWAAGLPVIGGPAEGLAGLLSETTTGIYPVAEVLRVVTAFEKTGLPVYLGGGWGVDALFGSQTRVHQDLDLVIESFDDADAVTDVLRSLGYRFSTVHDTGPWWQPDCFEYERGTQRVDVMAIDWEVLDAARTLTAPSSSVDAAETGAWRYRGTLAGQPVPCLSPAAQRLFHLGYPHRASDRQDRPLVSRAARVPVSLTDELPPTRLIVPVLIEDGPMHRLWRELNPTGLTPHITVMLPFLRRDEIDEGSNRAVREICAVQEPFEFTLGSMGWFEDRVLYLEPTPADPFRNLTEAVMAAFPHLRPYEGRFPEIVPHVTLAEGGQRASMRRAARRAERRLPLRCCADQAWLIAIDKKGDRVLLDRFGFCE